MLASGWYEDGTARDGATDPPLEHSLRKETASSGGRSQMMKPLMPASLQSSNSASSP